ncbi:MAG: hypothetical protein AB2L11_13960 [Syntrophobacteraceae bacterium]
MGSELHHNPLFSAIDIGSHTIRMIIARLEEGRGLIPVRLERRTTRLAGDFLNGGTLKEAGMLNSLAVLVEYASLIEQYRISSVACGATGVVRRAANGEAFLRSVEESTGIKGSILSEQTEAHLSAKGILSVLPEREGLILSFDLGGSSTEFLLMEGEHSIPLWSTSVFIGASTITERCLSENPLAADSLTNTSNLIREALAPVFLSVESYIQKPHLASLPLEVVGTAGTATTLAAMFLRMITYEPYRVNGLQLTGDWLQEAIELLARTPVESRRNIPGLESGREEIILGGALIVREILRGFNKTRITVTDGGLLEGILLNSIEEKFGWPQGLSTHLTWKLQKG